MRGTLLNTATVAIGACAGLAASNLIPPSTREVYTGVALSGLGLVTALIGVRMFFQSKNAVIVVAAIAFGGILGTMLGIAPALESISEFFKQKLGGGDTFNAALITTSVLFCVGPMTLLGCLQDGLEGKIELLAVKSTLDGIAAFFFAASLGPGVLVTAGVVLIFQGAITLMARPLQKFAKNENLIAEATAVGGALMLGIALGLLDIKKLRMETYLPALVFAPLFASLAQRLEARKSV